MGNIRPSFIKTRALRLLEIYPDKFTDDFDTNKDLAEMRKGVDPDWRPTYDLGVVAYLEGRWDEALEHLQNAQRLNPNDGPTKSLIKEMAARDNTCPSDWKRPGEERGFRQLTSK